MYFDPVAIRAALAIDEKRSISISNKINNKQVIVVRKYLQR